MRESLGVARSHEFLGLLEAEVREGLGLCGESCLSEVGNLQTYPPGKGV